MTAASVTHYGPIWQVECSVCHEMSDCFDSPPETEAWVERHDCGQTLNRHLPSSARDAGWKVVRT